MKKNVFSRTLAVLASTVVLGAASMMSANAAGETLTISSAEGKPGDTVSIDIITAAGNHTETIDAAISFDEGLTATDVIKGVGDFSIQSAAMGNQLTMAGYTGNTDGVVDGPIGTVSFTIPADAEVGTVYNIKWDEVNDYDVNGASAAADVTTVDGTITVVAAETEAPTEAETEAPTTTTKAPATGAPKTGTAGVAVAVAGLVTAGATAVVLKKRH